MGSRPVPPTSQGRRSEDEQTNLSSRSVRDLKNVFNSMPPSASPPPSPRSQVRPPPISPKPTLPITPKPRLSDPIVTNSGTKLKVVASARSAVSLPGRTSKPTIPTASEGSPSRAPPPISPKPSMPQRTFSNRRVQSLGESSVPLTKSPPIRISYAENDSGTESPKSPVSCSSAASDLSRSPSIIREDKVLPVINELFTTETTYCDELQLTLTVFEMPARDSGLFAVDQLRILFSNTSDILAFATKFRERLSIALRESDLSPRLQSVAQCFLQSQAEFEKLYAEYCKNYDKAIALLAELNETPQIRSFLEECASSLKGQSSSWNLEAMIIKPFQRILKYPLLLKEMAKYTPSEDAASADLNVAYEAMQKVGGFINEAKKRKDLVEKIVLQKKSSTREALKQRISRQAQKVLQVAGVTELTREDEFTVYERHFSLLVEIVRKLIKHAKSVLERLQDLKKTEDAFADGLAFVVSGSGLTSYNVIDGNTIARNLKTAVAQAANQMISALGGLISTMETLQSTFSNPSSISYKRNQYAIEYAHVKQHEDKGEVIDKTSKEHADAYVSLNALLLDEMPRLVRLVEECLESCLNDWIDSQRAFNASFESAYRQAWDCLISASSDAFEQDRKRLALNNGLFASLVGRIQQLLVEERGGKMTRSMSEILSTSSRSFVEPPSPSASMVAEAEYCRALYAFQGTSPEDLSLFSGAFVRLLRSEDADWWYGEIGDRRGWFPASYVEKL